MLGNPKKAFLLVQLLLFAGLFALGYGLYTLNQATRALTEQVERKFVENGERLDSFAARLNDREGEELQVATRTLDSGVKLVEVAQSMAERLDLIEQELSDFRVVRGGDFNPSAVSNGRAKGEAGAVASGQASAASQTLAMRYAQETGRSDWGDASADDILQAFTYRPYFSEYGGDLTADCRQTTCRLEWTMPRPDSLPPAKSEKMLAMARFELLALAAANAEQVGQIDTKWTLENGQPIVTVLFQRNEQKQEGD